MGWASLDHVKELTSNVSETLMTTAMVMTHEYHGHNAHIKLQPSTLLYPV